MKHNFSITPGATYCSSQAYHCTYCGTPTAQPQDRSDSCYHEHDWEPTGDNSSKCSSCGMVWPDKPMSQLSVDIINQVRAKFLSSESMHSIPFAPPGNQIRYQRDAQIPKTKSLPITTATLPVHIMGDCIVNWNDSRPENLHTTKAGQKYTIHGCDHYQVIIKWAV